MSRQSIPNLQDQHADDSHRVSEAFEPMFAVILAAGLFCSAFFIFAA